jgi:hypothetical protein
MLAVASLAVIAWLGCAKDGNADPAAALRPLTIDQVSAKLAAADGKTFIFDDNPKESWVKGHVPTARWLDAEHVTAADLPKDKTAMLIFYCHNET